MVLCTVLDAERVNQAHPLELYREIFAGLENVIHL